MGFCDIKKCVIIMLGILVLMNSPLKYVEAQQVPCYFIFGDSLVDNGNNNRVTSLAKANYAPYGIDFPGRAATGRFSNGRTSVDVIAQQLGFNSFIPAYVNANGRSVLGGVNYASAAGGIRNETGQQLGQRLSFGGQLSNYQTTVQQMVNILGDQNTTATYLSRCIYSVGFGSNDYLNNYFMPNTYSSSRTFTPDQYATVLINQYSQQLRTLYNFGARKVALMGLGMIGCSPNALSSSADGRTCNQAYNSANQLFNNKLRSLVDTLNSQLTDAKFIYINVYDIVQDIVDRPASYGFTVTNAGCCGVGRNRGQITCLPLQTPCRNRNGYLFWDAFHPTEAANVIIGTRAYISQSSSDVHPYDIRRLAQL